MTATDLIPATARPAGQLPTAWRFSVRNQARNRFAWLLLTGFVPVWYLLMLAITGHQPLTFRLFATGRLMPVDAGHMSLITGGLSSVTIIVGFAMFAAIRRTLPFDRRLVFAGYRRGTLIGAKTGAITLVALTVAAYTALVLLVFWRPGLAGWGSVTLAFAVIALGYGSLGLLLGVVVRNDLEGFFLIIMGGLMDTFLQNPLGNPLANNRVLEWFPSFGPTQFAVGGSLAHTELWQYLAIGLVWPTALATAGLVIFSVRTRVR